MMGSKASLEVEGRYCINFCSNDYLGLSMHPDVIGRSIAYTEQYGAGSASSRLVSGSLTIHHELEELIASNYENREALYFGSGFQANTTILPALADRGDLILADKQVHNSIVQGGILSRATFRRFYHNDCDHLETFLKRFRADNSGGTIWVVSESLFSMSGDRAPTSDLIALCRRYDAKLYLDEAHAFGVLGNRGMGLASAYEGVDLILATFGKAGGSYGAFIACSPTLKSYLVNYCTGLVYSTAPPPSIVGAASAAIELIPNLSQERLRLARSAARVRNELTAAGLDTGTSSSHIIPVLLDNEEQAVQLSAQLFEKQLYVQAIRPPTVERSRLRITLMSSHTRMEVDRLLEALCHD